MSERFADILHEAYPDGVRELRERYLRRLNVLAAILDRLVDSIYREPPGEREELWKRLYDTVFEGSIGEEIRKAFEAMGELFPEYNYPDTTYQEDAFAWIDAVKRWLKDQPRLTKE